MPVSKLQAVGRDAEMPSFERLDRASLQAQAYTQLRRAVMEGVFKPGALITIRAAAEALGVSPMPVRAALQRLEAEGALVAQGSKRTLAIPALTAAEYMELRDIRMLMEGLAAERAATQITAAELSEVEAHCAAMQAGADAGDHEAYVRANWAFHLSIYRASQLNTLVSMIEGLWVRVGPYVALMMPDAEALRDSMADHWSALKALRRKDSAGARAAVQGDISHSAVALVEALRQGAHDLD